MGLGTAMLGTMVAARMRANRQPAPDYPPMPTLADPAIFGFGTTVARRARTLGTTAPQGNLWQSASNFVSRLPLALGK